MQLRSFTLISTDRKDLDMFNDLVCASARRRHLALATHDETIVEFDPFEPGLVQKEFHVLKKWQGPEATMLFVERPVRFSEQGREFQLRGVLIQGTTSDVEELARELKADRPGFYVIPNKLDI